MTRMGSVLHFLVDGLCICCLYAMVAPFGVVPLMGIFITYNVLAFGTQPLTGLWADAMQWKHWMLLIGDVLLAVGVLVASLVLVTSSASTRELVMFSAVTFLGLGNSLFHVWGGKQTAVTTGNDIRALGVFVSTGAFGLAIGGLFFSWPLAFVFLLLICLLSVGVVKGEEESGDRSQETESPLPTSPLGEESRPFGLWLVLAAMLGLMLFVSFRSSLSEVFSSGIVKDEYMILAIGATAMFGKMAGGWIAEWLGIVRALVVMLIGVAVCLAAPLLSPLGGMNGVAEGIMLLGLFLINCTMPVTLYLANVVLKGREGLAFGLLAAALIPGYLLVTM